MFEKEAEEYQTEKRKKFNEHEQLCWGDVYKDWKKGAEFGYEQGIARLEEQENALKKIAETVPDSYKDGKYLPESRLDIIGDICEEVLKE